MLSDAEDFCWWSPNYYAEKGVKCATCVVDFRTIGFSPTCAQESEELHEARLTATADSMHESVARFNLGESALGRCIIDYIWTEITDA
jgi:hypothetical protein